MADQEQAADFSIWSFCYAKGEIPRDFIEGSPVASNQGLLQIPMVYSVVAPAASSARPHVFLIDTGFASGRSMTGRQFADFEAPAEVLGKVELDPKDVKTILLTHLHFDHVGNIGAFKNATILLQRSEYEGWKRALKMLPDQPTDKRSWMLSSMNLDDMTQLDRAMADGRVMLVEGMHEVCPGIRLHLAAVGGDPDSRGPLCVGGRCHRLVCKHRAHVAAGLSSGQFLEPACLLPRCSKHRWTVAVAANRSRPRHGIVPADAELERRMQSGCGGPPGRGPAFVYRGLNRTYSAATAGLWPLFACHFATSRQGRSAGIRLE